MKVVKTPVGFVVMTDMGNPVGTYPTPEAAAQQMAAMKYTIAKAKPPPPGNQESPIRDAYQGAYHAGQKIGQKVVGGAVDVAKAENKSPLSGVQDQLQKTTPELLHDYEQSNMDALKQAENGQITPQSAMRLGMADPWIAAYRLHQKNVEQKQAVNEGQRVVPTQVSTPAFTRPINKGEQAEQDVFETLHRSETGNASQTSQNKDWLRSAQEYDKAYHEDPTLHKAVVSAVAYEKAGQKKQAFEAFMSALKHHGSEMSPETHQAINDRACNLAGSEVKSTNDTNGPNN